MAKVYDVKNECAAKILPDENKKMSLPQEMNAQAIRIRPTIFFVKMKLIPGVDITGHGLVEKRNHADRNQNQPIGEDLNNSIVAKSNYRMNDGNDEI